MGSIIKNIRHKALNAYIAFMPDVIFLGKEMSFSSFPLAY